jgi:hypothetical protein
MDKDRKAEEMTASLDEIDYSNVLVVRALTELLAEKGMLSDQEVLNRFQRLRRETKIKQAAPAGSEGLEARVALVSLEDLASANMVMGELLLNLLLDKGFLSPMEVEQLAQSLKQRVRRAVLRKQ